MDKNIDTIRATRKNFLQLMDGLSIDELNKIPHGFNNNIIWNFGHVIVSQQTICYKLSNLSLKIDDAYIPKYSRGTKPEKFADENEILVLKEHAVKLIDELVSDRQKGLFENFNSYTASFGVKLNNIEDAIKFITMHEGLHLGYAMALKRAIK
jgi:hypothetical protein